MEQQLEALELADNVENIFPQNMAPPPLRRQRAFSHALDASVGPPDGTGLPPNQAVLQPVLQPSRVRRETAFVIPHAEM